MASRRRRGRAWRALLALLVLGALLAGPLRQPVLRLCFPVRDADLVQDSATRHGLDPALVCAAVDCESGWDPDARSAAGARGLMQVMPQTARELAASGAVDAGRYDPEALDDPATCLEYGCAYLELLGRGLSSTEEVVCAYNAGPGAVDEWLATGDGVPDAIRYDETRTYLGRVMRARDGYRAAYPDGIAG